MAIAACAPAARVDLLHAHVPATAPHSRLGFASSTRIARRARPALRRRCRGCHRARGPVDRGVTSKVTFKAFDDSVIDAYFGIVNPLDKAGAYGIQEGRELIIAGWEGSFTNIMGLPMEATKQILTERGLLG